MTEALLSGLISVFLDRLAPQDGILKYLQGKKEVVKQIEKLEFILTFVGTPLEYAEEKQLTDKEVKKWLVELNEVITKALYLADDIEYQALQPKMEDESAARVGKYLKKFISTMFVSSFERNVIDKVNHIEKTMDFLSKTQDQLGLKPGFRPSSFKKLTSPIVGENSPVYGRDKDEKDILKFLLSDDANAQKPSVICIVGLCGLGKTTLAQHVYNNKEVVNRFKCRAWVDVYEKFDSLKSMKSILEEVTGEQLTTEDSRKLQRALVKALTGEKCLFVFDNYQNESSLVWDDFMVAFGSCAPGSKIIVTTCSKVVGSKMGNVEMHELHPISPEDCWKIFVKHMFNDHVDSDKYSELKKIGMKIIKKCEGLPLAVKCLVGVMRPVSDLKNMRKMLSEWEKKLEIDIWVLLFEENQKSKILPDLWPIYKELPSVLKRCLAYCSIFPKGYEFRKIDREKIILLLMAHGVLKPENGKRMEDVEEEHLEALISKSFFQYSSQSGKQDFVMHGLVHDFATRISHEFCFHCDDSIDLSILGTKPCHLSYEEGSDVLMKLASLPEPKSNLHTLLALPLSGRNNQVVDKSLLQNLFQKGGYFKILSLSGYLVAEIPESISKVKYLRYIDFSDTQVKTLPESICDLFKLQTLILSGCKELEMLPSRLADLRNLRHLYIRGTSSLKEMPPRMCEMKSLHRLSDFVLGENGGSGIKELAKLENLEESLCIRGLENIDVRDVDAANLKDKKFLTELILIWKGDSDETVPHQEYVLDALEPHMYLKQLTIKGYRGKNFPDWVGRVATSEVRLIRCKNCVTLPPFRRESFLKRLDIKCCEKLWENRRNWDLQRLSHLESLHLCKIGEVVDSFSQGELLPTTLIELSIVKFEKLEGLNSGAFQNLTSLQRLKIRGCPELECLPEGLPRSLSCLIIEGCPQLVQRCQRGTGDDWSKILRIPNIYIDGPKI